MPGTPLGMQMVAPHEALSHSQRALAPVPIQRSPAEHGAPLPGVHSHLRPGPQLGAAGLLQATPQAAHSMLPSTAKQLGP